MRMRLLPALAVLALAGCTEGTVSVGRSPILDGTLEPGMDYVVYVFHDWGFACTGTVVAPRVVVTAKHCLPSHASVEGWHVMVGAVGWPAAGP